MQISLQGLEQGVSAQRFTTLGPEPIQRFDLGVVRGAIAETAIEQFAISLGQQKLLQLRFAFAHDVI